MGLRDKLENIKKRQEESNINWEQEKEKWKKDISDIYSKIKDWFKDLEDDGLLTYEKRTISIKEENIGEYEVDKLILHFVNKQIILEPIGTLLVGAWGRIDCYLVGNIQKKKMILKLLEPSSKTFYWEIRSKDSTGNGIELSKENFESIIERWIGDV